MFKRPFYTFLLLLGIAITGVQAQNFESSNLPIVVINTQGKTIMDSLWLLDNGKFGLYKLSDFNLDGEINANDASIWRRNNGEFSGVQF